MIVVFFKNKKVASYWEVLRNLWFFSIRGKNQESEVIISVFYRHYISTAQNYLERF